MEIIGIAGGIGAGKSVVSRILRLRGAQVYDCDMEAKRLMDSSDTVKQRMLDGLGSTVLNPDGTINRPEVARIIFSDDAARRRLDAIVHSEVVADVCRRAEAMQRSAEATDKPCAPLYVESAIMATSGLTALMQTVLLVTAPDDLRLDRACSRSRAPRADIEARMRSQREEETRLLHSGLPIRTILNDGATPILLQLRIEN